MARELPVILGRGLPSTPWAVKGSWSGWPRRHLGPPRDHGRAQAAGVRRRDPPRRPVRHRAADRQHADPARVPPADDRRTVPGDRVCPAGKRGGDRGVPSFSSLPAGSPAKSRHRARTVASDRGDPRRRSGRGGHHGGRLHIPGRSSHALDYPDAKCVVCAGAGAGGPE